MRTKEKKLAPRIMGFMAREGLNYTLRPDFGGIPNSVVDSPIQDHSGRHGVNFAVCI